MSAMAPKLRDLEGMSDSDLIDIYDSLAQNTVVGTRQYLDEHRHRKHLRIASTMQQHTKAIYRYTVIMLLAVLLNVAVAIYSVAF